jgi:hypothetical protein
LEIDLVRDELAYDGLLIKTYVLVEPDYAVKARTTERVTDGIDFRP